MDIIKAAYNRHSVRHFDGKPLKAQDKRELNKLISAINKKAQMHMQLVTNEPRAFGGKKAKICNFTGCVNYLVIIGRRNKQLKEKAGYYGQQVVLKAQQMGINSCWVALTYDKVKSAYKVRNGEKLVLVIALGYGTTQGKRHESKRFFRVVKNRGLLPLWFIRGVKMALIAPTGRNQQGFKFELLPNKIVKVKNHSLCKDIDLGIIKYHFELGAGKTKFK